MFTDRRLPMLVSPVARRAALLTLLLLGACPAIADARNYRVDGRVTRSAVVYGNTVVVPLKLTAKSARKLRLGTRRVDVKLSRRARLPLSGAGATASRLASSAVRGGDRLKGIASLSRKLHRRLRARARPMFPVKRARVFRSARRGRSPGPGRGAPAPAPRPRTLEQIVADIAKRVNSLSLRAGEFGSLPQQIEARKLQLEGLATGLEGVTTALEALTSALEGREGTVDQASLDLLLAQIEALAVRVEALESATDAVDTSLGALESAVGTIGGALQELAPTAAILGMQIDLIKQFPGAQAQVNALDAVLARIDSRLGAAESALASLASAINGLNAQMGSLTNSANLLAASAAFASPGTIATGLNGLAGGVTQLETSFAGLAMSMNAAAPAIAALEGDALALETTVEGLCTLLPTACP